MSQKHKLKGKGSWAFGFSKAYSERLRDVGNLSGQGLFFANAAVLVHLVKESACKQGSVLEVMIVTSLDLSH